MDRREDKECIESFDSDVLYYTDAYGCITNSHESLSSKDSNEIIPGGPQCKCT